MRRDRKRDSLSSFTFRRLHGLAGIKPAIADARRGLVNAVATVFVGAARQRCKHYAQCGRARAGGLQKETCRSLAAHFHATGSRGGAARLPVLSLGFGSHEKRSQYDAEMRQRRVRERLIAFDTSYWRAVMQ